MNAGHMTDSSENMFVQEQQENRLGGNDHDEPSSNRRIFEDKRITFQDEYFGEEEMEDFDFDNAVEEQNESENGNNKYRNKKKLEIEYEYDGSQNEHSDQEQQDQEDNTDNQGEANEVGEYYDFDGNPILSNNYIKIGNNEEYSKKINELEDIINQLRKGINMKDLKIRNLRKKWNEYKERVQFLETEYTKKSSKLKKTESKMDSLRKFKDIYSSFESKEVMPEFENEEIMKNSYKIKNMLLEEKNKRLEKEVSIKMASKQRKLTKWNRRYREELSEVRTLLNSLTFFEENNSSIGTRATLLNKKCVSLCEIEKINKQLAEQNDALLWKNKELTKAAWLSKLKSKTLVHNDWHKLLVEYNRQIEKNLELKETIVRLEKLSQKSLVEIERELALIKQLVRKDFKFIVKETNAIFKEAQISSYEKSKDLIRIISTLIKKYK